VLHVPLEFVISISTTYWSEAQLGSSLILWFDPTGPLEQLDKVYFYWLRNKHFLLYTYYSKEWGLNKVYKIEIEVFAAGKAKKTIIA